MCRLAAAVVFVVCSSPAWLWAQDVIFTVGTASAAVHVSPSTGSPVIGTAPSGSRLEVTNQLGSWVKVSWPEGRDGVGFVHVSKGSLARVLSASPAVAPPAAPRPSSGPTTPPTHSYADRPGAAQPTVPPAVYIAPPAHLVGVGATMGGTSLGFGGTVRTWTRNSLGLQVEVSRHALASTIAPGRVTSIQFAPSLLYSLPDRLTDYVLIRPYAGGGATFYRQSFNDGTTVGGPSESQGGMGFQAFGGTEMTFASVPKFAVSVGAGYQQAPEPFAGFDSGGFSLAVSGHWYFK
ncbi:MAG TPA: SH3 domain-containing protein [Vicinamibacterales bacterium]|nr:SH3 domain-containing protein [Vicinamibacterales bacterium]